MPHKSLTSRLESLDKKYLWHPFTQHYLWDREPTLVVKKARGAYFYDHDGRAYLDAVSSLWVNVVGHNHPQMNRAIKRQLGLMAHTTFLGLSHEPGIRLAEELVRLAPKGLTRVFYSDNGASAVEVALKMAYQYWLEKAGESRPLYVALRGSYHGDTLGAVSVGSIGAFHSKFKPLLFDARFAMAPSCARCPYNKNKVRHVSRVGEPVSAMPRPGTANTETGCRWNCLSDVEFLFKKQGSRISAAILEPLFQGAAGMTVMPRGYLAGFQALCRRYGILLIADEVATGFGRTGTLFACEQENIRPDFLCLAKGLTGGYAPLAATLTTNKVYRAFYGPPKKGRTFYHGHSYTGYPLGAAAGLASLGIIRFSKLLEKSRKFAHIMREELERLTGLAAVGSVRQTGLVAGVELVQDKGALTPYPPQMRLGARVCRRLLKDGIWMRPLGDVLVIMPPLVITEKDLRRLIRAVGNAITKETTSQ